VSAYMCTYLRMRARYTQHTRACSAIFWTFARNMQTRRIYYRISFVTVSIIVVLVPRALLFHPSVIIVPLTFTHFFAESLRQKRGRILSALSRAPSLSRGKREATHNKTEICWKEDAADGRQERRVYLGNKSTNK